MASVVLNQPLANQHIEPIPLNRYVTEVPQKNFCTLKCKAISLKALEIITWVALVIIVATALVYSSITAAGTSSLLMAGLILSTPLMAILGSKFSIWSTQYSKQAEIEGQVALHLKRLIDEDWGTAKIEQFFREQGIDIARVPLDALRQVNPEQPLRALLPLIARFNFLREKATIAEQAAQNRPVEVEEEFRRKEAEMGSPIDAPIKNRLRLEERNMAWVSHEFEAIPRALDAAVMLHIIQQPTLIDLNLSNLGSIRSKTFDERTFDRIYAPINDDYFVFHPDLRRQTLALRGIEQNMTPSALRLKLFPYPIRA